MSAAGTEPHRLLPIALPAKLVFLPPEEEEPLAAIVARLRAFADAEPASLVGRYATVNTVEAAERVQAEVRRALAAGDRAGVRP